MSPHRVAAIVLVIGAGLVSSYLIIKNSVPAVPAGQAEGPVTAPKPLAQNPVKWLEEAAQFLKEPAKNLADAGSFLAEQGNSAKTKENKSVNLTELVGKTMFVQMRNLDQNEKNPFQGQGFDTNDPESQKLIAQAIASLGNQNDFFNVSVDDRDLKISNDNSREVKIRYLEQSEEISRNRLTNSELFINSSNQIITDINSDCFSDNNSSLNQKRADLNKVLLDDYFKLTVPSDWIGLYKQTISHFKKGQLIYQSLATCSKDPIKAYLAAEQLPYLIQEAAGLQELLINKYREVDFKKVSQ